MSRPAEFAADTFAAAAGSSLRLLRQQPPAAAAAAASSAPRQLHFGEVLVRHEHAVTSARWNRNNKVVASGCEDGQIHLCYSNGQVMCVLPRDGTPAAAQGCITSLSWSGGSKRLAAGSTNGRVYVFDMQQKLPTAQLPGHLGGVTAVEYHHEDKFLAVASGDGSVVAYADPYQAASRSGGGAMPLHAASDTSAKLCLSVAAGGEAVLAAGSAQGTVAVWDMASCRVREEYSGQHSGAPVSAVQFVPLRSGLLYSAGADGRVCLQDRQAGPGRAACFSVGAPATALMIKEDNTMLGVGTADGVVLLYDPRYTQQPLHTMNCGDGQPVTALHWQHRYGTLTGRQRTAAPASTSGRSNMAAGGPSRLGAPACGSGAADGSAAGAETVRSRNPTLAPTGRTAVGHTAAVTAAAAATTGKAKAAAGPAAFVRAKMAAQLHARAAAARVAHRQPSQPGHLGQPSQPGHLGQPSQPGHLRLPSQPGHLGQPSQSRQLGQLSQLSQLSQPALAPTAAAAGFVAPHTRDRRPSLTVPASRTATPSIAPAAAAEQPMTANSHVPPAQPAAAALQEAGSSLAHITPLQPHPAAAPAAAEPSSLAITPLPGMAAPRFGANTAAAGAASGEITPVQQRMQHLNITPVGAAAQQPAGAGQVPVAAPLNITPLSGSGSAQPGGSRQMCITPLPGMHAEQAAHRLAAAQRSVLGECTNSASSGGVVLPAADPEVPAFAENKISPLPGSPGGSKPHNGTAPNSWQQQHAASSAAAAAQPPEAAGAGTSDVVADRKAKVVASTVLVSPAGSGHSNSPPWSISAATFGEAAAVEAAGGSTVAAASGAPAAAAGPSADAAQQQLELTPATAAAPASSGDSQHEFSFAAAELSLKQLSGMASPVRPGAGWVPGAVVPAGSAAEGSTGSGGGLREDIYALHLDMLTQMQHFQAQQRTMEQLVLKLVERNEALTGEVTALRGQLAALTGRRDEVLWL